MKKEILYAAWNKKDVEFYPHQLLPNCICVLQQVFRLMSDGSLGWLLHCHCYGIRRVCAVAFGCEAKSLVAWCQEKEERITRRQMKQLGQPDDVTLEPSQRCDTTWAVKGPWAAGTLLTVGRGCAAGMSASSSSSQTLAALIQGGDMGHWAQVNWELKWERKILQKIYGDIWVWMTDKFCGIRTFVAFEGKSGYLVLVLRRGPEEEADYSWCVNW